MNISDSAVLIRISKLYDESMTEEELYEATRGVWRIGARRNGAEYVFAIAGGMVLEVYKIKAWTTAGTLKYNTRPRRDIEVEGRWEFSGEKADEDIRARYVGKSVKEYFPRGASNPITYVNC